MSEGARPRVQALLSPFGDDAVRFAVPTALVKRRALLERLRALPGVRDVVLCEEVGGVVFEPDADRAPVAEALAAPLDDDVGANATTHVVRVVYDGEDLDEVAAAIGGARADVIARHAGAEYHVAMLGFLPGFAYLRGLPEELCLPRRAPRPRVPARSLAIGAEYTGIYPVASAGGWHLLGHALDAPRFALGDKVRFAPELAADAASAGGRDGRTAQDFGRAISSAFSGVRGPQLRVTRVAGLALFVDAGRPGQMFRGMPPGGPMVRADFLAANARLGQGATCTIELTGTLEVEASDGPLMLAHAGGVAALRPGERLRVASDGRRVTYLAVAHGFDGPVVEGSRNALFAAGIGRPLRRDDVLVACGATSAHVVRSPIDTLSTMTPRPEDERRELPPDGDAHAVRGPGGRADGADAGENVRAKLAPGDAFAANASANASAKAGPCIVLRAGPDLDEELRAAIEAASFTVSPTSDRAGTRLVGPALPAAQAGRRPSTPMTLGAIERTPSGLVVLGPDHPTTGGYPVPAVVAAASLDAFFALPLGAAVHFRFASRRA